MSFATTDPTTGTVLGTYSPLTDPEVDARLARAEAGFRALRGAPYPQRAGWLRAAADLLDAEAEAVADTVTTEMGKTLAAARAEVAKCARACRYFAAHGAALLADEPLADPATVGAANAYVRYQPLGPVLAVMPWNFPLWQVIRFAAPALMAGNPALLKPAPSVPRTGLYLADVFTRAGFPDGAFQTLLIEPDQVPGVLADRRVAAATVTGSVRAGRAVAAAAGDALKKTVLELGGSDPFVVMPSADLGRAATVATVARCQNNGQSCIAAKRFLVHADVYDAFAEAFVAAMSALVVGDPRDPGTDVGPLATAAGRDGVAAQVRDAVDQGAAVRCGGGAGDRPGWWYPPTVVADLAPAMQMWDQEVFGPVAGLFRVGSYEEAVALANGTRYGLGATVWSEDPAEQERFVADLDAGTVCVNGMVTSYPELPFGGVKDSGYGRELSAHGIREFCNAKSVWLG